jgi:hypothetical protein
MQIINKNDLEGTSSVIKFRSEVKMFYINCLSYSKKSLPLKDKIIQNAVLIDPFNRQRASQESLLELLSVLPGHIVPLEDREALYSGFFDYQALDSGSVPAYEIGDRVDAFWVTIQRIKDPATGSNCIEICASSSCMSF